MIRKLLATTAIATFLITGAYAQSAAPAVTSETLAQSDTNSAINLHLASNIIDKSVYSSASENSQNIGKVIDLIIDNTGSIQAIVVGVGGFLGIGQKEVALQYDLLSWAERPNGEQWLVLETTKQALEELPDFDRSIYNKPTTGALVTQLKPAGQQDLNQAETKAVVDTASGTVMDRLTANKLDPSTLLVATDDQISADKLIGTKVYGSDNDRVGEINDIILSNNGSVEAVILDVGGFLGIGEKKVAVSMENLSFMVDASGDLYLYTPFTKEALEAQAAYDKALFQKQRDIMLMHVK